MAELDFGRAIDAAVAEAMAADENVIVLGEDVALIRRELAARFGASRVRGTPISESAFLGAGVGAAMVGLRPIVEIMLVDFIGVCFDALLNHAAKLEGFTGGRWNAPMVVRATCGGGYGDGGQHEQVLASLLAGVPGLSAVLPSNPADAAGLMMSAIESEGPVVFLEHKLLSGVWLDWMGGTSRATVDIAVPAVGKTGEVAQPIERVPLGSAVTTRHGGDLALISIGVGVHHCMQAANQLAEDGIDCAVLDLRSVSPLDVSSVVEVAGSCGRVLVVDEDYLHFGLSGEIAAVLAEAGVQAQFARTGLTSTIPYALELEAAALPSVEGILKVARDLS